LKGEHYTNKSDIWSLGVVLYFMIYYDHTRKSCLKDAYPFGHPSGRASMSKLLENIEALRNKDLEFPKFKNVS
jgi:serine/threonine protein kinase